MDDRYLDNIDANRSRTGCFVLLALLAIGLATAGWFWVRALPQDEIDDPLASLMEATSPPAEETSATETVTPQPASQAAPTAPVPASDRGRSLLAQARQAQQENRLSEARELGLQILDQSRDPAARESAETLLGEVNIRLVTEPWPMPEKIDYTIQRGDSLAVLARTYGTTIELIQKSNRLPGSMIRIGDRLRILQAQFSLVVSKSRNDLVLKMNDRFFKRYRVGTGQYERTPVGSFEITDRIAQPTWWRQDGKAIPYGTTNNVLGTHWLSINVQGYGLHGTWEPESIGYQSSAGCVRLLNDDIEELYTLLPVGVPVVIEE
jgi:lipoprotein-anchoring transpeptidase ErfK/SrfK